MSEKSNFIQPEFTHTELGIHLVLPELLKYQAQMLFMLFFALGIDQNVVDEYDHNFFNKIHEHFVHHVHEICWCIFQSNGITVYSYIPYLVVKEVLGMSCSLI